ncbi:hypothetical protein PPL_09095 [Heterostelium album PN500]|uniref:Alpha-mannosidase n=1 Tax=Heterostelium pallidum (strain ATCC 26659 / Pp 5 / PN500) TaxID=670386 RepID=D3BKL3_HETP5|nr:hypothetical protein PPL_09095 [Heterostelium album PN500]EFA78443.1 hypothetical protein PPL_09095 [Heterostelium album PN500]|eukprot:XP_020430568.1 hypothetical protein PPL_09095 [Heterostelium album PN500]
MIKSVILFVFLLLSTIYVCSKPIDSKQDNQRLNVFLIPHSHCDVGWVQTYEQYYTENVTVILTGVIESLLKDPSKRFNWAEVWWSEQTDWTKSMVRELVQNQQLEFIGGGWAQNDEAVAHYQAVINQMTLGHQFLLGEFGVTPKVGWQIDPFGASNLTPMLFRLMGFQYHVIDRVDQRLKYQFNASPDIVGSGSLIDDRSFEFNWYPSASYSRSLSIFTHILDDHYNTPEICYQNASDPVNITCTGFDFESNPQINPPITPENIAERADILLEIVRQRSLYYRHNNLLVPFGSDFSFQEASMQFGNMDLLIAYINSNSSYNVNIRYATLSEYFQAVEMETQPSDFPDVSDTDYFTYTQCLANDYANFNNCINYWSGYFTSFPLLKQTVRDSDSILRSIEILFSLASATPSSEYTFDSQFVFEALELHRNVSGILTHHDAVTGTAKEYVRNDYFNMLWSAQNTSLDSIPSMVSYLLANESIEYGFDYQDILLKGMTIGQVVVVSLSNSLAWSRVEYVDIPVGIQNYAVYDYNQQPIPSQLVQRLDTDEWHLYFEASVPALGITTYFIMCIGNRDNQFEYVPNQGELYYPIPAYRSIPNEIISYGNCQDEGMDIVIIGNDQFQLHFQMNPSNNYLLELKYYMDLNSSGNRIELNQKLYEYDSMHDDCYHFRVHGEPHPLDATSAQFYLTEGPLLSMVIIVYSNNVTQLFTVYNSTSAKSGTIAQEDQYFEIENIVSVGYNYEISMRFNSSISNGATFYSNNGLETIKREWMEKFNDSDVSSLIVGNFYPSINTAIIKDSNSELAVLHRQSMGVSSQANGLLEFLLIRRSDNIQTSIHEALNDTSTTRIKSRILVGQPERVELLRAQHTLIHENPLLKMFAPIKGSILHRFNKLLYQPIPSSLAIQPLIKLPLHSIQLRF